MTVYLGKQQVAMTMNHVDESAVAQKVDKVTTPNIVYGTDSNGDQTTYDKNSFGQVDDVKVNGTSVVDNKVASITLGTMAGETASEYTKTSDLATVATSGSYNDLSDKPSIPAAQVNSDWNATSGVAQILNKPTLGTMASENTTSYYTKTEVDGKLDDKQDIATAVNYDNITNCITEIPQDIKLELNNGTLTLKAGSKFYVPDGKNTDGSLKFDAVIIKSDKTFNAYGSSSNYLFLCIRKDGSYFITGQAHMSSGTTIPTDTGTRNIWYDTDNNIIKTNKPSSSEFTEGLSLPIAIIGSNGTGYTSINQVFNGFGYIGSTVFALPGVKGLIPNGRNEDGSLKNIEFVVNKVITSQMASTFNNGSLVYLHNGGFGLNYYKYDNKNNCLIHPTTGEVYDRLEVASVSNVSGVITSFTPKTTFHAVDYNDLEDKLNHLNNPFSLLDYKWSEYELNNASWLLSNGQFNSGATYTAVYELLLKIKNGTETKAGVSVKLSTEAYTDTDFVLNTSDTTFRLPIKVKLASGNAVIGNGMALGLTGGKEYTDSYLCTHIISNNSTRYFLVNTSSDNPIVGGKPTTETNDSTAGGSPRFLGVNTDPLKSGIETSSSGLKLYFYVGETVQDANVIAASQVLTKVANGIDRTVATDRETVVGWGMPDYDAVISIGATTSGNFIWNKIPRDGFVFTNYTGALFYINNTPTNSGYTTIASNSVFVSKGKYVCPIVAAGYVGYFAPLKGVN